VKTTKDGSGKRKFCYGNPSFLKKRRGKGDPAKSSPEGPQGKGGKLSLEKGNDIDNEKGPGKSGKSWAEKRRERIRSRYKSFRKESAGTSRR